MSQITSMDDVIDSRDVIARLGELETEVEEIYGDWMLVVDDDEVEQSDKDEDDALGELRILMALKDEADSSPDWEHGETLIRDTYFEDYARQLAEDIGAIDPDASWPLNHIDWEAAAEALQVDYMSVDYDGDEYWIRA